MADVSTTKDADEEEVFDINDFTTASEWERFIALIEEALHDWQLTGNEDFSSNDEKYDKQEWQEQSTTIKFSDFPFILTYHFKSYESLEEESKTEPNNTKEQDSKSKGSRYSTKDDTNYPSYINEMEKYANDFPGRAHCLVRWYGLERFITLCPANSSQPILSASKAKILVSSLNLAANNTNCHVPLFVQVSHVSDKVFMGVGVGNGMRTDFEMAYIQDPPVLCNHLSGLLDVLKNKVGLSLASEPVYASVRFTYIVSDWPHASWTQLPPDLDATLSDIGFSELGKLPFGALSDPISELQLSTTWPMLNEDSVKDSEAQSNLSPSSAPIWSARLSYAPVAPCLLSENLSEVFSCCQNENPIVQILGHEFDPTLNEESNIEKALDRLTSSSVPSFSSVISRGRSKSSPKSSKALLGPIPEDTMAIILNFLFPDAQESQTEGVSYADPSNFSQVPPWAPSLQGIQAEHPLKAVLQSMKSCSVDTFVWRLSVVVCHVVQSFGGLSAVAHLYYEILLELRFRCDNAILLPGLSEGVPDLATCLFHQKLQMLNCCIKHRLERESRTVDPSEDTTVEDEEEEFYECNDAGDGYSSSGDSGREYISSWDKPEGRLKKFGMTKLLKRNDYLYIPITQEAAPLTEDRLNEHADQLMRLGTDSSGSAQRARMMSSALLSDMESFKAANPGSVLEDFVRWYSPRDWIEDDENEEEDTSKLKKCRLSSRMQIEGNLWLEVWENAKPVPSRRQKRLFDDTREIERVLYWFNSLTPGGLCQELLPVFLHASLCRIAEEEVLYTLPAVVTELLPNPVHSSTLSAQLEVLSQRVVRLSRQPPVLQKYLMLIEQVAVIERSIAKALSLRLKLLGHSRISEESFKYFNVDNNESTSKDTKSEDSKSDVSSLEKLVYQLLHLPEVVLEDGPRGIQAAAIKKLFSDAKNALLPEEPSPPVETAVKKGPTKWDYNNSITSRDIELGKPAGREYLLRAKAAMPAYHSRTYPQRMYVVILKNSFRLAGAISQDTIFC